MEDEERQKKLEAGKAKLAEYRQRKAHADSQKKQKKKKKKKADEDSGGDSQGRVEDELERSVEGQEVRGGGEPTAEFSFTKTLRSGETVRHDQTYKIEPESEVSTTAEDYSSEEEAEYMQQLTEGQALGNMEDAARTQAEAEPTPELDGLKAAFETEGVQQLQDFEAALKQRDGIITQLTSNLQQAREEKDEIMKEFLALTDESKKLHLQFQQLQAGETLRNSSHSSTAADLFQARQQLLQNQQQLEERVLEVRKHQDRSREQLELISQLEHKLSQAEMTGRRSEESFLQKMEEKELLIAEQEKVLLSQKQWMEELRAEKESFAQILSEKSRLILEQSAIIAEHERSLALLREELSHAGRSADHDAVLLSEGKELRIADLQRVVAERDHLVTQLQEELQTSGKRQCDLQERMAAKESELKLCLQELEDTTSKLVACQSHVESCKLQLEKGQMELLSCKSELAASKEKERKSSGEIMQLMGTVEDLQKRCHQGGVSDSHSIQKVQEEKVKSLELLRAELDEQYGQQIVQMKQEVNLQHAARVQQMVEEHQAEIELLKAQQLSSRSTDIHAQVESLNAQIKELKETLERSQMMHNQTSLELSHVLQERFKLQAQVQDLLRDRDAAEAKVEQVSHQIVSQERKQLLQLQETIRSLRSELSAAQEATQEAEAKHESEITNYKIKLEMLEREKDAVLDRMAESQEAELERLRTQLLFSHEEELTNLREGLQRENFLNTENLLNAAAVKHRAALEELGRTHAEDMLLLQQEKESFAVERDELLHQILALKEDLKLALHSSKADDLVLQLQHVKSKAMRDRWLLQGMGPEEEESRRKQLELDEEQGRRLEHMIHRLESEIGALESEESQISAKEQILRERLKETERSIEDLQKSLLSKDDDATGRMSALLSDCMEPDPNHLILAAQPCGGPPASVDHAAPRPAMFAMEINVQHDPRTGEQRILSANRVNPLDAAQRGVKVYDDGRKVVYEVMSSGGVSTTTVENGWSSAQVDELVQQAVRPVVQGGDFGKGHVRVTPAAPEAYVSPADVDDLSPPSCAPPSIPSSPPAQVTLQRETRLGMIPPSAPIITQPGRSAQSGNEANCLPQASMEHPVTMVFLGYHDVEDMSESRRLLGFDGTVKAEVVLIDEDDEKSLREKTVTDISVIDGTAADLVSGRPATSEAISTELSSDGREQDSGSSPPANPDAHTAPPPGLTPATGTDKRKRCQCCILM